MSPGPHILDPIKLERTLQAPYDSLLTCIGIRFQVAARTLHDRWKS